MRGPSGLRKFKFKFWRRAKSLYLARSRSAARCALVPCRPATPKTQSQKNSGGMQTRPTPDPDLNIKIQNTKILPPVTCVRRPVEQKHFARPQRTARAAAVESCRCAAAVRRHFGFGACKGVCAQFAKMRGVMPADMGATIASSCGVHLADNLVKASDNGTARLNCPLVASVSPETCVCTERVGVIGGHELRHHCLPSLLCLNATPKAVGPDRSTQPVELHSTNCSAFAVFLHLNATDVRTYIAHISYETLIILLIASIFGSVSVCLVKKLHRTGTADADP